METFKDRCAATDEEGFEFIYGPEDQEANNKNEKDEQKNEETSTELNTVEAELEEYLTKDPVAKFQFEYNRNTCFGNDVPEINVQEHINEPLSIAPGEGKIPTNLLMDDDWDMKAHPCLDPTGENNLNKEREVRLSALQFFEQRLLNVNKRFANTASFVFAAVQYIENKQLTNNINISFNRGTKTQNKTGGATYSLEDPYCVFDNISNTPKYWKKKKDELIAKLENLGAFHFFFTLSCADARYEENFTSLLQDHDITYELKDGKETCLIDGQDLDTFLRKNQSKHEFIRQNILTGTRNFNHRVKSFIKNIVMSKMTAMCVKFYNFGVEVQMRGAGHIHGVLWVDLDEFLEMTTPQVDPFSKHISKPISSQASKQNYEPSLKKSSKLSLKKSSKQSLIQSNPTSPFK